MIGGTGVDERPNRSEDYLSYLEIVEQVDTVFTKIRLNHFITSNCMNSIVNKLYTLFPYFLEFVIGAKLKTYGWAKNAVDTAVLAATIASKMELSITQIYKIIQSALLHDVGMFCIPQEILNKSASLSKMEHWYILTHPVQGYQVIERELECFEGVAQVALQHHESWNGAGYPKGLSGSQIDPEAQIIAITDTFCAMISERPYRCSLGGHQAIKTLLANNTTQFDPAIVSIFIQVMGIYPIGSLVELNNGMTAQVIAYEEGASLFKPRLRILSNTAGDLYDEHQTIDLVHEKGLFIKKAIAGWETFGDLEIGLI
ncbi:MAG: HD-GYP domain-containing protein [Treponema sp.]|jgi:HD-GYP domain-containing protein (c-di-GMP phosphodiesterase class II)|nr:HD-GYP domain-containing protein [Treponema sp.]